MIKLVDQLSAMGSFPIATAQDIICSDNERLQEKIDNGTLGGGDNSVTLTQEEFELLSDEEKLNGLYYTYDTKRIYKNGIQYGVNEPLELTMAEFKALKEAGALDEKQEYIITTDENGVLLEASDIGYNGTTSGLSSLSVQGAIDEVNDKVDNIIDDENVNENTVLSSKKIMEEINGVISDTTSSTTSTYSSAKIDEKIAGHSLPLVFDSGIINNSSVQVYKLANVGYTASGGTDAYNLNLLLSSRGAEEIELIGGKNDGGWIIEAIKNNKSFNKITNIYQDGLDIYVRLDLRCNYFRVYYKSGVLSGGFAVSLVDTVPTTATELTVIEHATEGDLAKKQDKEYISGITDANDAIGGNGVNIFIMSASSANTPLSRTGVIRSYTTIEDKYIRINQEYSTIDNSPQNGGTYKRYGSSDNGGVTFAWSNWNFAASIDDSTTALLKTWSSSKIASYVAENAAPTYSGTVIPTTIASGVTITTDWNITSGGSNADNGRLLMLNGTSGTFLIHIKGNLGNTSTLPTPTVVSSIASSQSGTWSTDFELSISSSKLRIKNKSSAVGSWRFV